MSLLLKVVKHSPVLYSNFRSSRKLHDHNWQYPITLFGLWQHFQFPYMAIFEFSRKWFVW